MDGAGFGHPERIYGGPDDTAGTVPLSLLADRLSALAAIRADVGKVFDPDDGSTRPDGAWTRAWIALEYAAGLCRHAEGGTA